VRIRLAIPVLILSAVLILPLSAALAAGTLDQEQSTTDGSSAGTDMCRAQTFTAGLTGNLDRVSLLLEKGSHESDLTVQIRDTSPAGAPGSTVLAGAPGSTVLASRTVARAAVGSGMVWVDVDFAPPASVAAGVGYAITIRDSDPVEIDPPAPHGFRWFAASGDPYPPGFQTNAFSCDGPWGFLSGISDHAFKTYVTAPDPDPDPVADFVTGLAVIPAGATAVTVNPGLDITAESPVLLTPRNNLGNRSLWVEIDPVADTFTIRLSSKSKTATSISWLAGETGE
jgi:opacity protein-like surface antigen